MSAPDLRIALVNNMPDAGWAAAERQFTRLIDASRDALQVRIDLYCLRDVPHQPEARRAMGPHYRSPDDLFAAPPDALIVTGAEPRAADLTDEPYFAELARLIAWAHAGGVGSALYSCLAAHAAALVSAGVRRRPLPAKLSGLFASEIVAGHELTGGAGALLIPHSRTNDLDAHELTERGYLVLARSSGGGVDAFVRDGASLEAFWQGHPEYATDTLAREARRDLRRFAQGETQVRPTPPENYFAPGGGAAFERCMARIESGGRAGPVPSLETLAPGSASWAPSSRRLMRAFLAAAHVRKLGRASAGSAA